MADLSKHKKKITALSALGGVAVLIALWFVLFGAPSLITKENVEARLQEIAGQITDEAKQAGKNVNISFGEVEIAGWGYNKHAVVHNVSLDVADATKKTSFASDELQFSLDQANTSRVLLDVIGPVKISENGNAVEVAVLQTPLRLAYLDAMVSGVRLIHHDVTLPKQIVLTLPNAADSKEPAKVITTISYNDSSQISFVVSPDAKTRNFDYQFGNLVLEGDNANKVTIALLASHYSEAPGADGHVTGKYTFTANDVVLMGADKPTKPYALNLDLSIDSENSAIGFGNVFPHIAKGDITINDALFAGADFKVRATGKVSATPEDTVLFGDANVNIEGVQAFLANEIISDAIRPSVAAALAKIAGKDISADKDLTFAMKREKAGVFYIGQTNFEDLATTVLAGLFAAQPVAAAPTPPAEGEPSAAPAPAPADAAPVAPVTAAPAEAPKP